jgi:hypothetical protein
MRFGFLLTQNPRSQSASERPMDKGKAHNDSEKRAENVTE